jgi:NAD(P)H-hydrate epimerase
MGREGTGAFTGPDGRRVPSVTRAQMLEIDRVAMEEATPTLLQMMENAGRSLAETVIQRLGDHASSARVLVLAGKGGNGGGGICGARHLARRVGQVDLCLLDREDLSPAARAQFRVFTSTEGREISFQEFPPPSSYDLVIDAVIGYSLGGAPRGNPRRAIEWMGSSGTRVVSLDLPSGLDADTGETPGVFVAAEATLTLHLPKPGLRHPAAGVLWLADLGIPAEVDRRVGVQPCDYGPDFRLSLVRG